MNKADKIFIDNIKEILNNGCWDENPRPRYKDGTPAHTIFITQVFEKYDIDKGEFPITTLRPIPIKSGIGEMLWIYRDESNSLDLLKDKYKISWWDSWNVGDETIGQRYGATVRKHDLMSKLLNGLIENPFGRRHIVSLWQEQDFKETKGLHPCAFQTLWSVRKVDGSMYLDMTLNQRSSDYLVAGHINKMQFVSKMIAVAKHCGYRPGVFAHSIQNVHIYDRHLEQARELLSRTPSSKKPTLKLNVPNGTNFYDIQVSDFELTGYEPVEPQLKFELGI